MRYHIVGIAGAGMSGVAQILLDQGHAVQGSDLQRNALTEQLAARGARVLLGHDASHVAGADALIATSAAREDHVELVAARAQGIPVLRRADLWHAWSRQRQVVAVAGTHGKTTTTALIALALVRAGMDPGFLLGGEAPDLGTNARWGAPDAPLVIEADEYDRTFLALAPSVAVITNVEWDHVDIYPTPEAYEAAFRQFARSVADPRRLIVCGDDAGALRAADEPRAMQYGVDDAVAKDPASCRLAPLDWTAANLRVDGALTRFEVWRYSQATFATSLLGHYAVRLPGVHNVRNALAALVAATALGAPHDAVRAALESYGGTKRRFELKGEAGGVTVVDDYAHHPSEVRATLAAARTRFPGRRVVAYLQPHTYSRTAALLPEWADAFADADVVRVGAIYAARESDTLGMDAGTLAGRIRHQDVAAVGGVAQAAAALLALLRPGDVLLTLGAGDGYRVGEMVLEALDNMRVGHQGMRSA
ncbi:MAG TPA: UDP-N-acetylmuramate--L-alanine ligase [Roseiflexaceae bacterium]|nr:UDP-N-acetylmuramate--L-alanine ligase [Roseiflexaceae bacterium]